MEKRDSLILRHKKTGLFLDRMNNLSKELWQARRFVNEEQLDVFINVSIYSPENPEDYEPVKVKLTIQEVEEDANSEG